MRHTLVTVALPENFSVSSSSGAVLSGLQANIPTNLPVGTLYFATDTQVLFVSTGPGNVLIVPPLKTGTLADIPALPVGVFYLTTDTNTLYIGTATGNLAIGSGEQGPAGPEGPAGPTGPTGATGSTGAQGPQGPAGPTGPTGSTGATGSPGTNGTNGTNGATGATGAQGPQGNTGATGSTGATGTRGSLWYEGSGSPGTIAGQLNNDFYLDTATGNVWELISGTWTEVGNIKGATGATGAQGATGPQGPAGTPATVPSGSANEVYATPNGSSGNASLRALVAADIPSLPYDASGAAATAQSNAESFATSAVATETARAESAETPNLAQIDLLAQAAAISATPLFTPSVSGLYQVKIFLRITQKATTSSTLGGVTLAFTDPDDSSAQSCVAQLGAVGGSAVATSTGNTVDIFLQGCTTIHAKAGVAVTYACAYVSSGTTPMQYSLHMVVRAA
jgi:Collagen triple helix repeat (20 copies)